MNFHVRFSAQRAPANDDLARKISLAMIFHASSFLFSQRLSMKLTVQIVYEIFRARFIFRDLARESSRP